MAILEVKKDNNRQLQNIANTLAAAKKIVVVTGAGISTNCGIPVSTPSSLPEISTKVTPYRTFDRKKGFIPKYKHKETQHHQTRLLVKQP